MVGALANPLGDLAAKAVATPEELQAKVLDLAINDVVAPFLDAGSKKLGESVAGALARRAGLTLKAQTTPPKTAVVQVQTALQAKLTAELASMVKLRVIAGETQLAPNQLASELAGTIAHLLAADLAEGMIRLPPSNRFDDRSVTSSATQVTKQQLRRRQPPLTNAYTVQPGDSLWDISRRLLGPGATTNEIEQTWRLIYRDNYARIGANPNRLVAGQLLRIPRIRESVLSRGWVLLPPLVALPGAGFAFRRRRRSNQAEKRRPGRR